jgi:dsRNA-specific ribonuclease
LPSALCFLILELTCPPFLQSFGSRLLGISVQALIQEKQQSMSDEDAQVRFLHPRIPCLRSPSPPQRLQQALLGNTCLSHLSRHYKLPSFLPASTLSTPSLAADPAVQAALFRAYVAGLWEQEGDAYTRQWVRQCFRSFINDDYSRLRKTIAEQEAKKLWPEGAPSPDTPLNRFNALVKARKLEVEWNVWVRGVTPRQAFKAEVSFEGVRFTGGGRTARTAQQDAAAKALQHLRVRLPFSSFSKRLS